MVNKRFRLEMLVMVLVFGMMLAVIGCDLDADDPLNGTWVFSSGEQTQEMKLDNGDMEMSVNGTLAMKGTYTTSDNKLTSSMTSIHGDFLNKNSGGILKLESKWYSKDDLKAALEDLGIPGSSFGASFESMFSESTTTYSLDGDTLTVTSEGSSTEITFTRK